LAVIGNFYPPKFWHYHLEDAHGVNFSLISFGDPRILPHATGRIDIKLNVDIPVDTELVEPLQEGSIWCQARGAATEVSGLEVIAGPSEKVLSLSLSLSLSQCFIHYTLSINSGSLSLSLSGSTLFS
jgi:hypothetical protein